MPSRWTTTLAATVAALAVGAPTAALAEITTRPDASGRTITFDLQAAGVDVDGYAGLLAGTLHGDEISAVTVRVVPASAMLVECGAGAAACYRRSGSNARITVPAASVAAVRDSLVHEYGHHVDSSVRHLSATNCSDGTPRWWAARGAAASLASGNLRCDYGAGWERSVAEVFAEDYRVLNVQGAVSRGALGQPGPAVLDALRLDLADLVRSVPAPPPGAPPEPVPPPDPASPGAGAPGPGTPGKTAGAPLLRRGANLARSGRLRAGKVAKIRFRVTGRQRIALVVRRRGSVRRDFSVVLRCGRAKAIIGDGRRRSRVVVRGRVGPGLCTAKVRAGRRGLAYGLVVRIRR